MIAGTLVCLSCVWLQGQGPLDDDSPAKKVTFQSRAARLERLLPELSKAAGVQMTADGATKNEVVLLRVTDMSLKDLMAKTAEVVGGEWKLRKGVYELGRSSELLRKQIEEEKARLADLIKKQKARIVKELAGRKTWDQAQADSFVTRYHQAVTAYVAADENRPDLYRDIENIQRTCSIGSLGDRVLLTLDTDALASMRRGDRLVFANNPTRMQRALPQAAIDLLGEYSQQRALIANAVRQLDDPPESRVGSWFSWLPKDPAQVPARMLVTVTYQWAMSFDTVLLDRSGAKMDEFSATVMLQTPSPATARPPLPSHEVTYSEDSQRILNAVKATHRVEEVPVDRPYKLPADLETKLYDPERYDPLATIPTDWMLSLADAWKVPNVIAIVPDDLLRIRFAASKTVVVDEVLQRLLYYADLDVAVRDGLMSATYRWPVYGRGQRVDRASLREVYEAYRIGGQLNLDDAANFLVANPGTDGLEQSGPVAAYPDPWFARALQYLYRARSGMRLYGALSPVQRTALAEGRMLSWGSIGPKAQAALFDAVYRDEDVERRASGREPLPEALRGEPTEVLPTGIPSGTTIQAGAKTTAGYFPMGSVFYEPWKAGSFAELQLQTEDPEKYGSPAAGQDPPKLFRPGRRLDLNVIVQYLPAVRSNWTLEDRRWDVSRPAVTPAELPADLQEEIRKEVAALRKRFGG